MKPCSVKIGADPIDGTARLSVAGHDVSKAVRELTLFVAGGHPPELEVHLASRDVVADFPEAVVKVVSWRSPLESRYRGLLDRALRLLEQAGHGNPNGRRAALDPDSGDDLVEQIKNATTIADKIARGEV